MIFAPATLAFPDAPVIRYELNPLYVLHHHESELRLDSQAQWGPMSDPKRLSIHFVRENGLRIARQINVNRSVKIAARR
jgi:hypothetical protein